MSRFSGRLLAALLALSGTASHAALQFTDWTTATASSATGTVGIVNVSLTGSLAASEVNGNSTFFDSASFSPPLGQSDYIQLLIQGSQGYTLSFSQAVTDPLIHVFNLASTVTFTGINPVKLSGDTHFAVLGNSVTGDNAQGQSNGTLRLLGTFSSITFTGNFSGSDGVVIQVGFDPVSAVPEPQVAMLWLVGLAAVGVAARRRKR